ncbi:type I inositol-1,4,5-trisphosphate [Nesidiocoris tenuis]|uniref:inositol-polyphosphate 5-phosphatase n=1 Tax=Nesidiocoris tenuis TaxID=355587 RepID=A0ABN7B0Z1_9HEMI|nr:type I inositol-1,4,5-trisphosphate [Nesidiocoris tenuis]
MSVETTPFLLVTANVGSIFEDPTVMLKVWTEEFLATVARLDPKFIALHCQEVGGKKYEESMQHVEYFVKLLMESEELRLFDKVRIFLDEDYSSAETFTALGNFYFIHETINDVLIWDFKGLCFEAVEGKSISAGDIEAVPTKEKSKFPQDFFPECKWSRKGFMRTRWNLNGTVFDLVNIHLFHDASNFVAMESYPSVYSKTRQRALEYTLNRFHTDEYGVAPLFLFGDFNFRTDTQAVVKKLCDGLEVVEINNGKTSCLEFKDKDTVVLTLGKKEFRHNNHQAMFLDQLWLKEFDKEMDDFCMKLFEFPIHFPPSYPFIEDSSNENSDYMETRCPAWCDRVLLSQSARPLVHGDGECNIEYGLIGKTTCMGDHKPIFLLGGLEQGAGRISCC